MSGTFDKKSSGAIRRQARLEKELKAKRKTRIIAISVSAVLAVLLIGALFINSKYARRTLPAVTIGGRGFSAAEFDYFYRTASYEYIDLYNSQLGEYASDYLPANQHPPYTNQINPMTGDPWSDTFKDYAISNMTNLVQKYNAAIAAGFVMSDEDRAKMESDIDMIRTQAATYEGATFESYLQAAFGPNMNEALFRKISEMISISNAYNNQMRDSFTFTNAELAAYYDENKDTLDIYAHRFFLVRPEAVSQEDYETTDEYDAAVADALDESRALAAQFAAGIESEDDFIAAAREYDETLFADDDSTLREYPGAWLGSDYGPWLMEPDRQYGDVTAAESTSGAYVVFFVSRDSNDYRMTEMRQMLFMRPTVSPEDYAEGADDPEYLEAFELADAEARERAEAMLDLFVRGGATEDALLMVMTGNTDDSTEGGFYDKISKDLSGEMKVVPEIEEWLFDPARHYGDYELIRTESYGYHLVFFMGYGERYCDYLAESKLRDEAHKAWSEGLDPVDVAERWAFIFVSL